MSIGRQISTFGDETAEMGGSAPVLAMLLLLLALSATLGCSSSTDSGADASAESSDSSDIVVIRGEPIPPGATIDEVLAHPDPFERVQHVARILQRSTPEDLERLQLAFESATLEGGDVEYELFGYWWATFDPITAFTYADSHLRMEHSSVLLQVIRAWAHRDPIGALESSLLSNIETQQPGIRDEFVEVVTVAWFESGLPGLDAWMVSQPNPRSIQTALRAYGRMQVLRLGPEGALQYARTAPFEQIDRRLILAGTLNVVAHQDPALAVRELESLEAEGLVDTVSFLPRIARSWSHHEPAKTLDWVLSLPESDDRAHALNRVARNWIRRDEASLAVWLQDHVGEEWTDTIRNQAIRWHVNKNYFQVEWENVMARAFNLTDNKQAQGLAAWVLQRWLVADRNAAEAWLDAYPDQIDEALVERVRKISKGEREKIEKALEHKKLYSAEEG